MVRICGHATNKLIKLKRQRRFHYLFINKIRQQTSNFISSLTLSIYCFFFLVAIIATPCKTVNKTAIMFSNNVSPLHHYRRLLHTMCSAYEFTCSSLYKLFFDVILTINSTFENPYLHNIICIGFR